MTNLISRFFGGRPQTAVQEVDAASSAPPVPYRADVPYRAATCTKCHGYFRAGSLKPCHRGSVRFTGEGDDIYLPYFETVYYCPGCEPVAPIVFVLQDSKGEELETRCFTVENGWFQDVDKESGEDRYTISLEDYNHTFCMNCGQRIEETECQEHRPSAKKEKK